MNMQDKDLDQLFSSKLDGLEAAPSARVWANISHELNAPKHKKSLFLLLRIAASVIIVISAGLFFLPKKQVISDKPKNRVAVNMSVTKHQAVTATNTTPQINAIPQVRHNRAIKQQQSLAVVQQTTAKAVPPKVEQPVASNLASNNPSQVLVVVETNKINKPVVPDNNVLITSKTLTGSPEIPIKNLVTLAAVSDKENNQTAVKTHKIHGLGSFINAVIGVVDKRDDKIIEFTDTDEGNTVTGINLGIITVKKNQ